MTRNALYGFHHQADNWLASQIPNIGMVDGSKRAGDNDGDMVTSGDDAAICRWLTPTSPVDR